MRRVIIATTEVKRLAFFKRVIHREHFKRAAGFVVFTLALVFIFLKPLLDLVAYAARSELYSFIFLVPFISLYLAWLRMREVLSNLGSSPIFGSILLSIGILIISRYYTLARHLGGV